MCVCLPAFVSLLILVDSFSSSFFQDEMDFILANRVEDVLRAAFDDEFPGMAQAISSKPLSSKL